jgi:hypothetical protein
MRKHTPRKRTWKLVDPIAHAIEGAALIPANLIMNLQIIEQAAISAFMNGTATKSEWRDLAMLCNISEQLCLQGVGSAEVRAPLDIAQEALRQAARRYKENGRVGFSGVELTAMRDIIDWHDLQRTSIPRKEYEKAIESVRLKIVCKDKSVEQMLEDGL